MAERRKLLGLHDQLRNRVTTALLLLRVDAQTGALAGDDSRWRLDVIARLDALRAACWTSSAQSRAWFRSSPRR